MTVRVLVIDDEPDGEILFRQEFRREVRQGHYKLDFALSGKAALETLDGSGGEGTILLICEISARGISGLDLLKAVKARWRDLPVFMISKHDDRDTLARAMALGAGGYLGKPVDFAKLKQDMAAVMTDGRANG